MFHLIAAVIVGLIGGFFIGKNDASKVTTAVKAEIAKVETSIVPEVQALVAKIKAVL